MPIHYMATTTFCEGVCGVEEAEGLLAFLLERCVALVDLGKAEHLHTAIVQVLLASNAFIIAPPRDPFLREILAPALERTRQATERAAARSLQPPHAGQRAFEADMVADMETDMAG